MINLKRNFTLISILFVLFLGLSTVYAMDNVTYDNMTAADNIVDEKTFDSIQTTIDNSNESDIIVLDGTYVGSGSAITVNKSLTIRGTGDGAKLDAQSKSQILKITANNVVLDNLIFVSGTTHKSFDVESGGAIESTGDNLEIISCSFKSNSADYGGAVVSTGSGVSIVNSTFEKNIGMTSSGALELRGPNNYVDNCSFLNNLGYHAGGAIGWTGENGTLTNSIFKKDSKNSKDASQFGGAIVWLGKNGNLTKSIFYNNEAKRLGAAVYWSGLNGSLTYCIFNNNTASNDFAYYGNPDFEEYNFWGFNSPTAEDELIYYNQTFSQPKNWVNIDLYPKSINFTDNGIKLKGTLPDYPIIVNGSQYMISNNFAQVIVNKSLQGTLSTVVINEYGLNQKLIHYPSIIYVNKTGDDTKDLQNAIDVALEGSKIILSDSNYSIESLTIDKAITLEGNNATIYLDSSEISLVDVAVNGIVFVLSNSRIFSNDDKITTELGFSNLNIILKDADGNILSNRIVEYALDGKIYSKSTDENGIYKVQVNSLKPGSYMLVASFAGDNKYASAFGIGKITINKQKATLTVKTKTLKLKTKNKIVKVVLKDKLKKAISKRTLKITINKKTYSTKTNSKGLASFKVVLKAKKSYKYSLKFKGDEYYKLVSKTGYIKVK